MPIIRLIRAYARCVAITFNLLTFPIKPAFRHFGVHKNLSTNWCEAHQIQPRFEFKFRSNVRVSLFLLFHALFRKKHILFGKRVKKANKEDQHLHRRGWKRLFLPHGRVLASQIYFFSRFYYQNANAAGFSSLNCIVINHIVYDFIKQYEVLKQSCKEKAKSLNIFQPSTGLKLYRLECTFIRYDWMVVRKKMEKQEALSSERFISLRQPGVSQFHFHPTQQVKRFPRFIKPEAMKLDDVYKLASSDKMMHSKKLF